MSNVSNWLNYKVYPSIFERVDTAFPEHKFNRTSKGWRSKTYLNGTPHTREDKTVINEKALYCILEQGGETKSLYDYVKDRDKLTDKETLEKLSQLSGIPLPKNDFEYTESYRIRKEQASILEQAQSYFIYCLNNSSKAKDTKDYLASRGYSEANIEVMELGYIPGQKKLFKYLIEIKKHKEEDVKNTIKLTKGIGESHLLTIPYREPSGQIKGFTVRAIEKGIEPKYYYSTGLKKSSSLFNLKAIKGDKDLVIVEGILDALNSEAKGLNNIVALGGTSLNKDQIEEAIKRGANKITLCLDNDKPGEEATLKALKLLNQETELPLFIATLPKGIKDPDQLIKEKGVEVLQEAINKAVKSWEYSLQNIINLYLGKEEDKGELTAKDINSFLEEVVTTASKIKSPVDKDLFIGAFLIIAEPYNISKESLEATIDKLTYKKAKEEQEQGFKNLLNEATNLNTKGETNKALELLGKQSKQLKQKDKEGEFSKLLLPVSEEGISERLINKPNSLNSGYKIDQEKLLLPSGALSFFVAPTSHGKTSMLINLLLNAAQENPKKKFCLFSYEEDRDSIILKTLNTYIDKPLSQNNRKSINTFYSKGEEYFQNPGEFHLGREKFFNELITPQRININYVEYSSEKLIEAIRYFHKARITEVGAIFIDYMQLLKKEGKFNSRQEELKQICIDLKDVAVETGLPIILGAQFNREVVNHLLLHPTKIGEAGDIERVANLIVGLWNNNFKPLGASGELNEIDSKNIREPNTIYAKVLKNRDGIVGKSEVLEWNGNTGKISSKDNMNF